MNNLPDLSAMTDLIYSAAYDERIWSEVLAQLADLVGAGSGMFVRKELDTNQGQAVLSRMDPAAFAGYFGYFAQRNPLAHSVANHASGSFLLDWQTMPKPELVRSEYYNDFLRPRDIHGVLGLVTWHEGPNAAVISLTRNIRQGEFGTEHVERLRPLMPHLCQATRLGRRLPQGLMLTGSLAAALDAWSEALILVSPEGAVRYANQAAELILARRDGLTQVARRLSAQDSNTTRRLLSAIARAGQRDAPAVGSTLIVPRKSGMRPYGVFVAPVPEAVPFLHPANAAVLVTVVDLARAPCPEPTVLAAILNLSPAQAGIATMLANGMEPREIAEARHLSLHTVRRHVTDILHRTDTARQADLIRLLVQLSPRVRPADSGVSRLGPPPAVPAAPGHRPALPGNGRATLPDGAASVT